MPFQYFQQLYSEFESVKGSQRDLPTGRLSDPVAYVIRKALLSGVLKPGSSIPERVLAQDLNVSRTPVREALFVLQGEGLVHLRHNRTALVAHFSQDDLRRVYSLRGLLEGFSAECAASNPDRSNVPKVEHSLRRYLKLNKQSTPIDQVALLLPWHELHRQVEGRGATDPMSAEESAAYFKTRPRESQLAAWASRQSEPLADRAELDKRVAALRARWPDGTEIPAPDFWGGYLVRAESLEFWHGRESRLHDRLRYEALRPGAPLDDPAAWRVRRCAP